MKILIPGAILVAILTAAFFLSIPGKPAPALGSDEVDYVRQLPNPSDLFGNKGVPDGAMVSKIVQTRNELTVTYDYDNGAVRTVTYRQLPSDGIVAENAPPTTAPAAGAAPVYDESRSAPAVLNQPPASVYYNSGPSNTVVYPQPQQQPAAPANYDYAASYPVAYSQPPPPVYYDAAPTYPVVYQQPAPAYNYYPSYGGYGYYPFLSTVVVGVNHRIDERNPGRGGVHVETRGGFRAGGRR